MTEANRNLVVRLASAAVLAPLLILIILWDRPEPIAIAVHLAVAISLAELFAIALKDDPRWMHAIGILLGVALSATLVWCPRPDALLGGLVVATLTVTIMHLCRFGELASVSARIGVMLAGLLYVSLLLTPLALLKRLPDGGDWIFLTLTLTFFSDTGAYAAGRIFGKHKLYPAISPGKTVEGALGGLCFAFGAAVLAKLWYMPQLGWLDAALITIPGGALAQAGDLVESMIKRGAGVKDSGRIIPGHGGLLDRIDALLFSTPYVYLYAVYVFFRPLR